MLIIYNEKRNYIPWNLIVLCFFKMDESSKVVTFNKPLEIEDLKISMNQGQFEETIPLQRQESWENKIPEEYRKQC